MHSTWSFTRMNKDCFFTRKLQYFICMQEQKNAKSMFFNRLYTACKFAVVFEKIFLKTVFFIYLTKAF